MHWERIHFFHILLCYSLIPKWIKFTIFLKILKTIPHNDNMKEVCLKSWKIDYKKRKNHMYISIHSLCSILCWSTFGTNYSLKSFRYDTTSFDHHHLQLSAILLLTSSPLKLCHVGWGQTHIFRFSRNIWLGSSSGCGWATQGHSQSCL